MAEDDRKIFVGGLPTNATNAVLEEYFGKYGTIESCNIKYDMETHRCRGFAFIVFKNADDVKSVLDAGSHSISGKSVTTKLADPQPTLNKVFVGGVDRTATVDDITKAFQEQGYAVSEVFLPEDREAGEGNKGYSFVTFSDSNENAAKELLKLQSPTIVIKDTTRLGHLTQPGGLRVL